MHSPLVEKRSFWGLFLTHSHTHSTSKIYYFVSASSQVQWLFKTHYMYFDGIGRRDIVNYPLLHPKLKLLGGKNYAIYPICALSAVFTFQLNQLTAADWWNYTVIYYNTKSLVCLTTIQNSLKIFSILQILNNLGYLQDRQMFRCRMQDTSKLVLWLRDFRMRDTATSSPVICPGLKRRLKLL